MDKKEKLKLSVNTVEEFKKYSEDLIKASSENITLEDIEELSNSEYFGVLVALATNKNTPVEILEKLSLTENVDILRSIISNKNITEDLLFYLLLHFEDLTGAILCLEQLSKDFILKVYNLNNSNYNKFIGEHSNTPQHILEKLIRTNNKNVLEAVANNKNTTPEMLSILSHKDNISVVRAVAENENITEDTMLYILNNYKNDYWAVINIVYNKNITEKVIRNIYNIFSKDLDDEYTSHLLELSNCPIELLEKYFNKEDSWIEHCSIVQNPNAPVYMLEKLALSPISEVRELLAINENITEDIAITLYNDKSYGVRMELARNKSLPKYIQNVLLHDKYIKVREVAYSTFES